MKTSRIPILVTGSQRSGTTWVGRTISQHPLVRYEHEPFNTFYPNPMFGLRINDYYAHYESSGQQAEIKQAFDKLLYAGKLSEAISLCRATGISRYTPAQFFKQLCLTPRQRILIKDPIALLSASWLYKTYGCQVICMIRNPLAFVASQKKADWDIDFEHLRRQKALMNSQLTPFKSDLEYVCAHPESVDLIDRSALLWNVLHAVILEYRRTYPEWLFIRHEDAARDPVPAFQRMFSYLGLEPTPEIQAYIATYTSARKNVHAQSTKYQPRDSKASIHAWQDILSDEEALRVDAATRKIAANFYDHSTS